jgi:hypothetical protein
MPLSIPAYSDPILSIDTPTDPASLTALFGPLSSNDPVLKVTISRSGPVARPAERYTKLINNVSVEFGTFSETAALFWRDSAGHAYLATLSGGERRSTDLDDYAEQLAEKLAFE